MAADGQVLIEITADNRDAQRTIKDTTQVLTTESSKWEQSGNRLGNLFKKLASGLAAAKIGQALVNLGKDALEAASALEEVQNVVDVTFGAGAKTINEWSKNAIKQFGLTETQAKQFTSTLGAMMKSSGVAGNEIIQMSTDLAGLAADMASFYNLDFETAFQKIRSGISGETEPLKQLGINMSVANLEAYMLTQGITRSFQSMSQGEQTMIRYQYLMQATADAQGDFARTSTEYANSARTLESQLDSLKTKLGGPIKDVLTEVLGIANRLFDTLFPSETGQHTILDEFAEIDANKTARIAEVQATAEAALGLVKILEDMNAAGYVHEVASGVDDIAVKAGKLDSSSRNNWSTFASSLAGIDGLNNVWGSGNQAAGNIESLANALSNTGINQSRAGAWKTIIDALKSNVGVLAEMREESEGQTWAWLETLANAANTLDPESAEGWDTLFTWLVQGIPGLEDTEGGRRLLEALSGPQAQVTNASEDALSVMEMLGIATEDVTDQNSLWLATCRELVRLIPSLGRIINTETGEIIGGAEAVRDYIAAWQEESVRNLEIEALQRMIDAYNVDMAVDRANRSVAENLLRTALGGNSVLSFDLNGQHVSADVIEYYRNWAKEMARLGYSLEEIQGMMDANGHQQMLWGVGQIDDIRGNLTDQEQQAINGRRLAASLMYQSATGQAQEYISRFVEALYDEWYQEEVVPEAYAAIQERINELQGEGIDVAEELSERYGEVEDAASGAAAATQELTDAQLNTWNSAINGAKAAADAVLAYQRQVITTTSNTLSSWGNMFAEVLSGADKTRREIREDLGDEFTEEEFEIRVGTSGIATASSMLANLTSRLTYLTGYGQLIETAREMGYSDEVLAQLADGSLESYDYLTALAGATPEQVAQINAAYEEVQQQQQELSETLAGYQLQTDEQYAALVGGLEDALNELDRMAPTDSPALAVSGTIDEVLAAISARYPALASSIGAVQTLLAQLTETSYGNFSTYLHGGSAPGIGGGFRFAYGVDGSFAEGLDYVPFDGFIGQLHRGEAVLTAQEAQVWREMRMGLDASTLSGAIWDNAPDMGGNVYLNGEAVGRIMSAAQADSYRQLERSGWRG